MTLALTILALVARLPWRIVALSALTIALYMMQYIFLWTPLDLGVPVLRALHPVNALALFWLTISLVQRAWQLLRAPRRTASPVAAAPPDVQTITMPRSFD